MSDKTGGSAFPSKKRVYRAGYPTDNFEPIEGMTLRDYFAAKAMDGFNKRMVDYGWDHEVLVGHAKQAYAVADAMLEARKKGV